MKKLLVVIFLTFASVIVFISPPKAFAQNKCGVNIGPNFSDANQVKNLTKEGGWIVTLGTAGNCGNFESLFGKGLNVVIRTFNGGKPFTNDQALAWVATLGKMDTKGQKVYFMPWNEPNHAGEGGGETAEAGKKTYDYSVYLKSKLQEAGLLGTKVVLLSPMIDKLNPSFGGEFFKNIPGGKTGFYNLFSGSSINEYDQAIASSLYLACKHPTKSMNNCSYNEIGIPPSFYALEAGVAGTATPPRYQDNEIRQMLDESWKKWNTDGSFTLFAIFSYDPHRPGKWKIFNAPQTSGFYQNNCTVGGVATGGFAPDAVFNKWLKQNESELAPCGNTCGFAPKANPSLCSTTGESDKRKTFVPSRKVTTNDTITAVSDTILLSQQSETWASGSVGTKNVTKGGFFQQFHDLTIPFARDLTEYLAGPFVYQYNTYIKEVIAENNPIHFRPLANLTPNRIQDNLRHNYWKGCFDNVYCSSKNIGTANCPQKENNECLISDPTIEIQDICPPPWSEFTDLPGNCPKNMDDWSTSWAGKWAEVPLFSNPKTEVKDSILMDTCPAPSMVTTTTLTRTPWISALYDVSTTLNSLFTSHLQQGNAGLSNAVFKQKSESKLLASTSLLAQNQNQTDPTVHLPLKLDPGQPPVNGVYTIGWLVRAGEPGQTGGCPLSDFTLTINGSSDNGTVVSGGGEITTHGAGGANLTVGQPFTTGNNNIGPFVVKANPGDKFSFTATLTGGLPTNCGGGMGTVSETCTTTFTVDGWGDCIPGTPFGGGTIQPPKCDPPQVPNFIPADPNAEPVYSEGHTLLKEDRYIGCEEWQPVNGELQCKKLKNALSYDINDPTWAEVEYPFLATVYDNLSGTNGLFAKLFRPSKSDTVDWNYAAESNITYCLTDHPAPAMIKGGELKIDKQPFDKPPARCEKPLYTKNIRAFPPLIGGVFNAKLWVTNEMLKPANQ